MLEVSCTEPKSLKWVTGLIEFTPTSSDSFLWPVFLKIVGFFSTVRVLHVNLDKNVLGYILGDFFTNSSGHSVGKRDTLEG
jgi:hypothetical protein